MDRDHELAQVYSDISRQSNEVEGEWYLIEDEKGVRRIELVKTPFDRMNIRSYEVDWGDKVTPVSIFRKT